MAFVLGDSPIHPLTADEVMRMLDAGIIPKDNRFELLHGMLTEKAVKGPDHCELKSRLAEWLWNPGSHRVRIEGVIRVADDTSLPEPDIAVVERADHLHEHPYGALLVAEVAKTSLKTDTQIKPPLYAEAGIPECWVVDIKAGRVRVFRDPTPDGYATYTTHGPTGTLQPLEVDVEPLDLAALFDGLR
ncbi:Uma2 family endonuclease [Solirubrobacter phytolaccae]|uniref:Uma2 family endonuclease n=1 Tax=Solirubrobacter phytolaccae TaxID=1404360 RepID=A0A9X3NJI9_9ACTN|nr:Uma2 family endonuclease [Solirubrobacter phytolaccae]MDA0184691.1 Uma2 family endonuclease [Solirubrobacter phytolaccae]